MVRTFEDFIKVDVYTGDSDPVYWAVFRAKKELGVPWTTRFCVAMLAYYHMGVAFKAADEEGEDFWKYLEHEYPTAPRGSERRHFRGQGGLRTLYSMKQWAPEPTNFFTNMPNDFSQIQRTCARNLSGFGPYFILKLVDYMDACLGIEVEGMYRLADYLPDEPAEAVKLIYPDLSVSRGFNCLLGRVYRLGLLAAPGFHRKLGPAEVETSLCGWKTSKYKGNWFGADIVEKHRQLREVGSERSEQFRSWLPPIVNKNQFTLELE